MVNRPEGRSWRCKSKHLLKMTPRRVCSDSPFSLLAPSRLWLLAPASSQPICAWKPLRQGRRRLKGGDAFAATLPPRCGRSGGGSDAGTGAGTAPPPPLAFLGESRVEALHRFPGGSRPLGSHPRRRALPLLCRRIFRSGGLGFGRSLRGQASLAVGRRRGPVFDESDPARLKRSCAQDRDL